MKNELTIYSRIAMTMAMLLLLIPSVATAGDTKNALVVLTKDHASHLFVLNADKPKVSFVHSRTDPLCNT